MGPDAQPSSLGPFPLSQARQHHQGRASAAPGRLAATGFLCLLLAASGCSDDGDPQQGPYPDVGPLLDSAATDSQDSGPPQVTLQLLKDTHVDISASAAARPDVVGIGDFLFLAYLTVEEPRTFRLAKLDADLLVLLDQEIYFGPDGDAPTDIRLSQDPSGMLWYAFETNRAPAPWSNYLHLARYDVSGQEIRLNSRVVDLAQGNMIQPPDLVPTQGDEVVDDPTPFFSDGAYYVVTRHFDTARHSVRALSLDFQAASPQTLDLSGATGGAATSQNALVQVEEAVYLVTGAASAAPSVPGATSAIMAIPLSSTLDALAGPAISLSDSSDYETAPKAVRFAQGLLFVLYNVQMGDQAHKGRLKVFDVAHGFAQVANTEIVTNDGADNHLTMELQGQQVFVFHQNPNQRIKAKVFSWQREPED